MPVDLQDPEDAKLVTLARATRLRTASAEGAAVRDLDGRTYTAATVALPHLRLSALELAVAMAVSSGAAGLEAAAVASDDPDAPERDLAVVRDLADTGVAVIVADTQGTPRAVVRT